MKVRKTKNTAAGRPAFRLAAISAAIVAAFAAPQSALAFEIPIDNPDIVMRWDNTVRYNLAGRVQSQDKALLRNVNFDDGDRNFNVGSMFNRFDVLSEFDFIYQRNFGFRVTGAGWWDPSYRHLDNTSPQTENTLNNNGLPTVALSPYSKRYAQGVSGEFLDAFGFANFDAGGIPMNIKAGQFTTFWGESLFGGGAVHSVSYGQYPLDLWKAFATPGAEAKEIFRPRGSVTMQIQPTTTLSFAGQWFYAWQAARYAESGTYLSFSDGLQFGGDSLITGANPFAAVVPGSPALARAWRTTDITPKNNTDWGVSAKWSPDWLDGTLGFYYRSSADIQPQIMLTAGLAGGIPAATCRAIGGTPLPGNACIVNPKATSPGEVLAGGKIGTYNLMYGTNIDIYGVSLSKNIGGVSVGAELSYRQNMPLLSDIVTVLPAPLANFAAGNAATTCQNNPNPNCIAPSDHGTVGALGNTWHGLVNALGIIPQTPVFDTASWAAEVTWMQWDKVTQNNGVFKGRSNYQQLDRVNKNFVALAVSMTPTWFQVYPGVDLLMPLSWSMGISGNSAVAGGGQYGAGQIGAGFALDIYQKYRVDLKYVGFFGNYTTNPVTGAADVINGTSATLSDRGYVALTLKTTF